jgi:acetyl esterase/lipase
MSRVALVLAILLALAAAAAAGLIVLPAPSQQAAFLAIAAGEKSLLIVGGAVVAAALALFASRPGTRVLVMLAVLLSLTALILALIPPAQALRLAGEQRVNLSLDRYLRSSIDTEGPVTAEKTVTYATVDGRSLGMDVYKAAGKTVKADSTTRVVMVIHGGGWSAGEKGDASMFSGWLAQQGITVFDVQYRTSPQPNWKTATGDVKCAIGWVKRHGKEWNVDPARITLLGRSAGGHLALLAAYTPGDTKLPPSCDAPDTRVESVISYYAPTDLVWGYANPSPPRVYDSSAKLRGFIGGPPESTGELYKLLSPTQRVTPAAPRTLLIHGGRDQFIGKQHVEFLTDKLHRSEVRFETLLIPYAQHAFDFVFGGFSEQIAEAVVMRFLDAAPPARAVAADEEAPDEKSGHAAADGGAAGDSRDR